MNDIVVRFREKAKDFAIVVDDEIKLDATGQLLMDGIDEVNRVRGEIQEKITIIAGLEKTQRDMQNELDRLKMVEISAASQASELLELRARVRSAREKVLLEDFPTV